MKRLLNITVLMDEACVPDGDPGFTEDPETPTTEYHVVQTLRTLGHRVNVLGVTRSVAVLVQELTERKPDLVFNLTEVFNDDRQLDKSIAALLEMLGIPFTGAGSDGLMLCRGKGLCKQLLSLHKIRVPGFAVLPEGKNIRVPASVRYPMVVKPAHADGSEGISNASLVADDAALRERVKLIHERWRQSAIAEEYVEGREFYVSILGNKRLMVLPAREVFFGKNGENAPVLATYHVKWNEKYQEKWRIKFGFAKLDDSVFTAIKRVCKRVYRILQLRDYGRIDVRLTSENKLVVLEANPNPDIAYGEEVAQSAAKSGISYDELIDRILRLAMRRYG